MNKILGKISGKSKAFTLVELIVAVGLLALLFLLINQLFNQTTRAVSSGIAAGDLTVSAEAINNRLQRDAENMLGPDPTDLTPGGFLLIFNRRIPSVKMPLAHTRNAISDNAIVRSDQLVYVRFYDGPFTPRSITPRGRSHWFPTDVTRAHHSMIWYGHAVAATPLGTGVLRDSFGRNTNAWTWNLARHDLIMIDFNTFTSFDNPPENYAFSISGLDRDGNPIGGSHPGSQEGMGGLSLREAVVGDLFSSTYRRNHGATDVINGKLEHVLDKFYLAHNGSFNYSMFTSRTRQGLFYPDPNNLDLLFHINSNPHPDSPGAIAQTHGLFSQNISDFIVEFAGNYQSSEGSIDTDHEGVVWYSMDNVPTSSNFTYRTSMAAFGDFFAFPHNAPQEDWPVAIRIRYRIHDRQGAIISTDPVTGDSIPGRWHETIIPVAR